MTVYKKAVTMRVAVVLLSLLAVVYGAQLRFDAVPSSVRLPDNAEECCTVDDAATVIANLLGITAEKPSKWRGEGDVLSRPSAALIYLTDEFSEPSSTTYKMSDKSDGVVRAVDTVGSLFEMQANNPYSTAVNIDEDGMLQYRAAGLDESADVENAPTTGVPVVDATLRNMHRLAQWLSPATSTSGRAADVYSVKLPSTTFVNGDKKQVVQKAIRSSVKTLNDAMQKAYKNNALITTLMARNIDNHLPILLKQTRTKRQTDDDSGDDPVPENKFEFTDSDYPAMFSIILFISLGLALAVAFIVFGMWTTEDDKESIIYRMTMPRQAKKDL